MYIIIENGQRRVLNARHILTLGELRDIVKGSIEGLSFPWRSKLGRRFYGYCNDEGKVRGMSLNVAIAEWKDIIAGPIVIGVQGREDMAPMTAAEAEELHLLRLGTLSVPVLVHVDPEVGK